MALSRVDGIRQRLWNFTLLFLVKSFSSLRSMTGIMALAQGMCGCGHRVYRPLFYGHAAAVSVQHYQADQSEKTMEDAMHRAVTERSWFSNQ